MTRSAGSMGGVPKPDQPPVNLTHTKTDHGRAAAYNHYKCRCHKCNAWRRSYDRNYWELKRATQRRKTK